MRHCLVCGRGFDAPARPGRPPETCSREHAAIRKMQQRTKSRKQAIERGLPEDSDIHGTSTGYTYYDCGCVKCRRWAREYKQGRRKAEKLVP